MTMHYLACDLGAESGRLMLGIVEPESLRLEEIHRFTNIPLKANGSLHWDIDRLFAELKTGLEKAAQLRLPIQSISADSWGLDYLLFDPQGAIIPPTYHYRDPRSRRGIQHAYAKVDWPTIFAETGIQFMPINTLFQLAAEDRDRLERARVLLGIGDAFNYLLSGAAWAEQSLASTFQLYNPRTRTWSARLIQALDLPRHLFPPIVPSGTRLGSLKHDLAGETGLADIGVLASCSHDTGAAVAAVPALEPNWAYLSSGTWSLMGVELPSPIISNASRELNFTNEIGYGESVRFLKNIVGLWILQECRRSWAHQEQQFDYATLTSLAERAPAFRSIINPDDPRFLAPDQMPEKIAAFCRETNQPVPKSPGPMARCVLESLALLYRRTLRQLEQLTGNAIKRLHIIGGGSKNSLLNQFTADALQIPVLAGPVEATATGNVAIQAITLGALPSLNAARGLIHRSTAIQLFKPINLAVWTDAYSRFEQLRS